MSQRLQFLREAEARAEFKLVLAAVCLAKVTYPLLRQWGVPIDPILAERLDQLVEAVAERDAASGKVDDAQRATWEGAT